MRKAQPLAELQALVTSLDSPNERVRAIILGNLKPELLDFGACQEIYTRILGIIGAGKDLPSSSVLAQDPTLTEKSRVMLASNSTDPLSTEADANALVDTLRKYYYIRELFTTIQESTNILAGSDVDPEQIAQQLELVVTKIRTHGDKEPMFHVGKGAGAEDQENIVDKILNPNRSDSVFVRTGFKGFDDEAGGLAKKNFLVVASHYKGGKSIFLLNMAINIYLNGMSVCLISLEMDKEEVTERLLSSISGVDYARLRKKELTPDERFRVHEAWSEFVEHGRMNGCRLTIWDPSVLTPFEIGLLLKPYGFHVVMIDYLNLLEHPFKEREEWKRLGDLGKYAKQLTGTLGCPVVAATQMSMEGDIRYAKAIKEHADYVLYWYRKEAQEQTHILEIGQMAARHTKRFTFNLREEFEIMRLTDCTDIPRISSYVEDDGELDSMAGL